MLKFKQNIKVFGGLIFGILHISNHDNWLRPNIEMDDRLQYEIRGKYTSY